jgi:hypothetical protein
VGGTSPANSISSSKPRFKALNASKRRAQAGKASRGNGRGGVVVERRVDAAAQRGSSGKLPQAAQSSGSNTSDTMILLTSKHVPRAAPWRRSGVGGENPKAAVLGFRRDAAQGGG